MGSSLKGKNLLLEEQILSFKRRSLLRREANMKMAELLSLEVLPVIFICVCRGGDGTHENFGMKCLIILHEKYTL